MSELSSDELAMARRLWEQQESLRAAVPGMQPLAMGDESLVRVVDCLRSGNWTEAEAEHVLGVFQSDALNVPDKARHFNGRSNWHPRAFAVALGMPVGGRRGYGAAGSYVPADGDRKKYSGGRIL